jgi:hypothetical protein
MTPRQLSDRAARLVKLQAERRRAIASRPPLDDNTRVQRLASLYSAGHSGVKRLIDLAAQRQRFEDLA